MGFPSVRPRLIPAKLCTLGQASQPLGTWEIPPTELEGQWVTRAERKCSSHGSPSIMSPQKASREVKTDLGNHYDPSTDFREENGFENHQL